MTSDIKLFHQFTIQRYACQVLCVLIHLMKPLTFGLRKHCATKQYVETDDVTSHNGRGFTRDVLGRPFRLLDPVSLTVLLIQPSLA